MTFAATTIVCIAFALLASAQGQDPRTGLKPGFADAGSAAHNMHLVTSLPKPEGFFDAKAPAGTATAPERPANAPAAEPEAAAPPAAQQAQAPSGLNFANSDLAFSRDHLVVGNFHGFNTYNIEDPQKARLLASVVCPGGQGDLSVYGKLLFMSVEQTRGRVDCGTQGVQGAVSAERFRGVRIFDISDVQRPRQIAAVQTCRGSHTHTLVTDPTTKRTSTCMDPAREPFVPPRSSRAAREGIPTRTPAQRSSASM